MPTPCTPIHGGGFFAWLLVLTCLLFLLVLLLWEPSANAGCNEICRDIGYGALGKCCCEAFAEVDCPNCGPECRPLGFGECACPALTPRPTASPCAPECTTLYRNFNLTEPIDCLCPPPCVETTPTPDPTPDSHIKGECCTQANKIYRAQHLEIVDRKNVELKAARRHLKGMRAQCHGEQGE